MKMNISFRKSESQLGERFCEEGIKLFLIIFIMLGCTNHPKYNPLKKMGNVSTLKIIPFDVLTEHSITFTEFKSINKLNDPYVKIFLLEPYHIKYIDKLFLMYSQEINPPIFFDSRTLISDSSHSIFASPNGVFFNELNKVYFKNDSLYLLLTKLSNLL